MNRMYIGIAKDDFWKLSKVLRDRYFLGGDQDVIYNGSEYKTINSQKM